MWRSPPFRAVRDYLRVCSTLQARHYGSELVHAFGELALRWQNVWEYFQTSIPRSANLTASINDTARIQTPVCILGVYIRFYNIRGCATIAAVIVLICPAYGVSGAMEGCVNADRMRRYPRRHAGARDWDNCNALHLTPRQTCSQVSRVSVSGHIFTALNIIFNSLYPM